MCIGKCADLGIDPFQQTVRIEMFFDGIHLNVEKELQSSVIKDIQEVTNSLEDIIIE